MTIFKHRRVEGTLQGTHIHLMPISYPYIILCLLSHFLMCLSHLASRFIYQSIFFLIAFFLRKHLVFKAICRMFSLSKLFWERPMYETNKNEATLIEAVSGPDVLTTCAHLHLLLGLQRGPGEITDSASRGQCLTWDPGKVWTQPTTSSLCILGKVITLCSDVLRCQEEIINTENNAKPAASSWPIGRKCSISISCCYDCYEYYQRYQYHHSALASRKGSLK